MAKPYESRNKNIGAVLLKLSIHPCFAPNLLIGISET